MTGTAEEKYHEVKAQETQEPQETQEQWWKPIRLVRICLHNLPGRTLGMLVESPCCGYRMTINSYNAPCAWQCHECRKMISNPIHRAWHFGQECHYRSGFTDVEDDNDDGEAYRESDDSEPPSDSDDESSIRPFIQQDEPEEPDEPIRRRRRRPVQDEPQSQPSP